mgnify:FL=1
MVTSATIESVAYRAVPTDRVEDPARIPLRARDGSIRAYALIDADDLQKIEKHRWHIAGGYAVRCVRISRGKGQTISLHRELLGLTTDDGFEVDHVNRDRLDNRRTNLRVLPRQGRPNAQNQTSYEGSSSRYRGVGWHKRILKWQASARVNGKLISLGYFDSELEAAETAKRFRLEHMPYAVD